MKRRKIAKTPIRKVNAMPTYLESAQAANDSTLIQRFEAGAGEFAQATVSSAVPTPGTDAAHRYNVCRLIQRDSGQRNILARGLLQKGLDKQELTITKSGTPPDDTYDTTDAEIQTSVSNNMFDPAFLIMFRGV